MSAMPFKQAQSQVPAANETQYEIFLFVDSAQLSYYDVSGGVSSEDVFVRVYLNIVGKSDGSIGYPPERLDHIKEILDNAFNPHDIYFIYDCEEHFVDDDDLFFSGSSFNELDPSFGPFFPPEPGPCPYSQENREIPEGDYMDDAIEWSGFSLSPVPATGEITVTWEFEIEVEGYQIYDIHGQLIQRASEPLSSGSSVDVSELPAGMYIFTLKLEDGSIDTQKMLVQ